MNIRYFSWVKDKIGVDNESISMSKDIKTVNDLIAHLKTISDKHNNALSDISIIRCAVNMEVVNFDKPIDEKDEIAIFPPMTGG